MNTIREYNMFGGVPPDYDPRQWDEPEEEAEEIDPRTEEEKHIEWICDAWKDALEADAYEEWRDVRMMVYGATQVCTYASGMHDLRKLLREIGNIAFENGLVCIQAGKYEGATK